MTTTTLTPKMLTEQAHLARNRAFGAAFIVIALAIYWLFARGVDSELVSTFGLNQGVVPASERLPDWVIPSYGTAMMLAVASAAIGAYQLARGFGRATSVMLGLIALFFIFSFLTWATRDQSINLAGMLKTMVQRAVPLTLGAMSGILCERAGVVNIAIEGMMLSGAMMAALVASVSHNLWIGLLAAMLTSGSDHQRHGDQYLLNRHHQFHFEQVLAGLSGIEQSWHV
jgi:simple sugar transport system permease protein